MEELMLSVNIVLDNKTITVPYTNTTTAEDVCIQICKKLNIGILTYHLFALRITGKSIFLMPAATFGEKNTRVDFRVRFKVADVGKLAKIDINAYNYYFHQVRNDVLDNKVPDIIYEKYRRELVGLGITDMYRVMLEKELPKGSVEKDYKKYIPKEVLKRHPFFIKKPIHDTLSKLQKSVDDASYVKAQYLKQLDNIAPEYLSETYKAILDHGDVSSIVIKLSPFDQDKPGINLKYFTEAKKEWQVICRIEDLVVISIRNDDGSLELSRRNGIPFYLKFNSKSMMYSFISLVDGYYRLTCIWTFSICKEVYTPSLQRLHTMKCHGPVGGEFSYAKLEAIQGSKAGYFIIRESESNYNHYYIDVCIKDGVKPKTFKLEKMTDGEFIFNDDLTRYKNIHQLMAAYNDPKGAIYLHKCVPPSEYDDSPLLLCKSENKIGDSLTNSALEMVIPTSPVCISCKDLQVYKGQKKEGSKGITVVFRSMWKLTEENKIEVALKMLKEESTDRYLKEMLTLAGQWSFLRTDFLVRLYGITFTSNISLVLEYFRLGPLDEYLRNNWSIIKTVDLLEAGRNLASVLWYLTDENIVHGNIRCRKLMVATHDDNSFRVKLTDPGIHTSYKPSEVFWIPLECYKNLNYAKQSTKADVWAFATTLWEIFMFGKKWEPINCSQVMKWHKSGNRLPKPESCSDEIYSLMKECWDVDPHKRKIPQAIMRDINQIYYQVYDSRRSPRYESIISKRSQNTELTASRDSLISITTGSTALGEDIMNTNDNGSVSESILSAKGFKCTDSCAESDSYDVLSWLTVPTVTTSIDSLNSIFELDENCQVIRQGKIGEGFYGEVFKGSLYGAEKNDPKTVAVKKLKTSALASCMQDFEREISIMKNLNHPNIVQILGVKRENEIFLVMEFVQHGSLQSYLKINKDKLLERQLLKYSLDIAEGMNYLGKKNIVHRDLAVRNILVVDENNVKISDFGLAQVMGSNNYYILKTLRELPIKWYAPESLRDGKFSIRSDVWSYGVTICELFNYGEEPQLANVDENMEETQQHAWLNALEKGTRFPCPPNCPSTIYVQIIYPCWEADSRKRPSFAWLVAAIKGLLDQ